MKKIFKKVMIILTVLLLFTTVLPNKADKEADASISMTLAGIAATVGGSAMLPYALGAAGILAVGGVIKNWDTVKEYGEQVIARMGGYDVASGSYVQNPDGTATVVYSPAMKLAMAQAVDNVPKTITVPSNIESYFSGSFTGNNTVHYDNTFDRPLVKSVNGALYMRVKTAGVMPYAVYLKDNAGSYKAPEVLTTTATYTDYYFRNIVGVTGIRIFVKAYTAFNIATYLMSEADYLGLTDESEISTADTFGTVADNVNARLLGMNAVIADNQAVTISADAELLNASIDDLASISDATLTETQTQTGLLSGIWKAITNLPSSIAAAGVAASTAINTKMSDLWEDAGAIWTGLADTATGIRADITAKMGALQDAMAGGIDNVRSGINDMIAGLNAGIDTIANNMASWGQLTLDGIDAGIGTITSGLTNTWEKITTGITEGVGSLTGTITTAMDDINTWITDFPTTMLRVFVPPNFDFMQPLITATTSTLKIKFGPLETLPDVFRNIFGAGKSIYDIEITVLGHTYKIVPIFLKPVIDGARPFLTGAINLMSLTILYRRYKGNLVIPA